VLCFRRAASHCAPCQQPQAAPEPVPAVLAHILMMTAFHWNTEHLSFLSQARPVWVKCRRSREICLAVPLQMVKQDALGAPWILLPEELSIAVHGSAQRHQ